MLEQTILRVADRRPKRFENSNLRRGAVAAGSSKPAEGFPAGVKRPPATQRTRQRAAPNLPEGWSTRLREQSRNLSRALEMLEQALGMVSEPHAQPLARAQRLRGAGLIALIAASELLVVAGWYEAEQAVAGGTRDAD